MDAFVPTESEPFEINKRSLVCNALGNANVAVHCVQMLGGSSMDRQGGTGSARQQTTFTFPNTTL